MTTNGSQEQRITVGNKTVGAGEPVFVIAEIGINHNGSLETAKKMIDAFADAGLYVWLFFESRYDDRLEILRNDLPKGKTMCHFEFTDIFKAKEMLRDVACIRGNVPISLLMTGTPEEVKEYCKKLIDGVGKDGGFIMDSGTLIHEAKPENVKAMIDFTKEYGVYR